MSDDMHNILLGKEQDNKVMRMLLVELREQLQEKKDVIDRLVNLDDLVKYAKIHKQKYGKGFSFNRGIGNDYYSLNLDCGCSLTLKLDWLQADAKADKVYNVQPKHFKTCDTHLNFIIEESKKDD